jgi:preprotein translocase subunit SecE
MVERSRATRASNERSEFMATDKHDNGTDDKIAPRGPLGWWARTTEFVSEVRNEMKRVTWPSQREVYATTVVVILTATFFGIYLFIVDLALNAAVQQIFQKFGAA